MRGHIAYVSNDPVQAYKDGYAKGLQDAREGVAAILADEALPSLIGTAEFRRSFLAAIGALRDNSGNRANEPDQSNTSSGLQSAAQKSCKV